MEEEARDSTFTVSIIHHRFFTFSSRFLPPSVRAAKVDGFERLRVALLSQNFSLSRSKRERIQLATLIRDTSREKKKKKKKKKGKEQFKKVINCTATFSRRFFSDGKTLRRSAGCTSCLSRSSRPGTSASFSSLYLCRNFPRKPRDTGG